MVRAWISRYDCVMLKGILTLASIFHLCNWMRCHFSTDVVFFIYLYQRWIYRVDPNRVNEFGTSGVDQSKDSSAQPAAANTTPAITDKPEGEKKND